MPVQHADPLEKYLWKAYVQQLISITGALLTTKNDLVRAQKSVQQSFSSPSSLNPFLTIHNPGQRLGLIAFTHPVHTETPLMRLQRGGVL